MRTICKVIIICLLNVGCVQQDISTTLPIDVSKGDWTTISQGRPYRLDIIVHRQNGELLVDVKDLIVTGSHGERYVNYRYTELPMVTLFFPDGTTRTSQFDCGCQGVTLWRACIQTNHGKIKVFAKLKGLGEIIGENTF